MNDQVNNSTGNPGQDSPSHVEGRGTGASFSESHGTARTRSEDFRSAPKPSAIDRAHPKASDEFREARKDSEEFGRLPKPSAEDVSPYEPTPERRKNHSLTIQEATRLFEEEGVPRTERTLLSWCHPNRHGIPRLDAYFDEAERRWWVSEEGVRLVIAEEQSKEQRGDLSRRLEVKTTPDPEVEHDRSRLQILETENGELERKNRDLEITNRVKEHVLEQTETNNRSLTQDLQVFSRRIGQLEAQLHTLNIPPVPEQISSGEGSSTSVTLQVPEPEDREDLAA